MQRHPDDFEPNKIPAETGNASNPAQREGGDDALGNNQLLGEKAEKYLREVASIEDVPDAQDQEEMDDELKENGGENK